MTKFITYTLSAVILIASGLVHAASQVTIEGKDTPNDKGGSIDLKWTVLDKEAAAKALNILVFRKSEKEADFKQVKSLDVTANNFADKQDLEDGINYQYLLKFANPAGQILFQSDTAGPFQSQPQWFNNQRTASLIFALISIFIILLFIYIAKSGRKLYVRPLPGVKAIEEAVGRATEMGKPCIFVPGISVIDDISTLASISILSKVSETIAEYNSRMIVPNYDPIVYSVTDEVVKNAYIKAGRPDAYRKEDVYYLTGRQFAYASGIAGLMAREKPATNFFLGWFMAESLILAESGSMSGAIQIAGTDSISQIPFFIVACDYTLIGEELYAAGAYMSNDPRLLGGIKGQDYVKLFIMIILVVFFILKIAGVPGISTLLTGGN